MDFSHKFATSVSDIGAETYVTYAGCVLSFPVVAGADPENELGGGQFRGSRGGAPVEGLGDFVPQKLTTFRS